jgi:hypothetical protein
MRVDAAAGSVPAPTLRSSNFLPYEGSKWFQQMSAQPKVRKA